MYANNLTLKLIPPLEKPGTGTIPVAFTVRIWASNSLSKHMLRLMSLHHPHYPFPGTLTYTIDLIIALNKPTTCAAYDIDT